MQEQMKQIFDLIQQRTKQPAYALKLEPEKEVGIFDSKFGGVPYWDLQKPYPQDADGNKLTLLAQFNFDNDKVSEPLPQKGMLQFFISPVDEMFGLDFGHPTKQNGFRVVYHETIDQTVTAEQVKALDIPWDLASFEYFPLECEVGISIVPTEKSIDVTDVNFDQVFREVANEVLQKDIGDTPFYELMSEEDEDEFDEAFNSEGHSLLGYPYFTQSDPREMDEYAPYSTLLFQIDSDYLNDKYYVIWGDAGVANFFIKPQDLKDKKFDDILYNWDCT